MASRAAIRPSSPWRWCNSPGSRNLRLGSPLALTRLRSSKPMPTLCSPRPTPTAICPSPSLTTMPNRRTWTQCFPHCARKLHRIRQTRMTNCRRRHCCAGGKTVGIRKPQIVAAFKASGLAPECTGVTANWFQKCHFDLNPRSALFSFWASIRQTIGMQSTRVMLSRTGRTRIMVQA